MLSAVCNSTTIYLPRARTQTVALGCLAASRRHRLYRQSGGGPQPLTRVGPVARMQTRQGANAGLRVRPAQKLRIQ